MLMIAIAAWFVLASRPRKPPSIFDTPVDGVFGYLAEEDFNRLSVEERMQFLQDLARRFNGMDQAESAVASSFFAGLTGPASEKLIGNARLLGKDILVQGAQEFLSLSDDKQRAAFLDRWIVKWFRIADGLGGETSNASDSEILDRLNRQGRRDLERGIAIDAVVAQQVTDFWERDIASVASPKEQAQIYQFLPAVRSHILNRRK
jgi:hypothetical protein